MRKLGLRGPSGSKSKRKSMQERHVRFHGAVDPLQEEVKKEKAAGHSKCRNKTEEDDDMDSSEGEELGGVGEGEHDLYDPDMVRFSVSVQPRGIAAPCVISCMNLCFPL